MNAPVAASPPLAPGARIGPDSVLQLVPLLEQRLGEQARNELLHGSGLSALPSGEGLMDEEPAARLHQSVRRLYPDSAAELTGLAGELTAAMIIERRMPLAALRVLRALPPWLSAPLLANTIAKHAWTFEGSGSFRIVSRDPVVFELHDNPVVRGERAARPVCHWHAAVFQRLFQDIVDPGLRCSETHCLASGDDACRFRISESHPVAQRER
jgi:divinyl protochlorophyllide a 8-vinyl-reductase